MLQLSIDPHDLDQVRFLAELCGRLDDRRLLDQVDPQPLHVALNALNRARLQPSVPADGWADILSDVHRAELVEGRFVEEERAATRDQLDDLPRSPPAFVEWFAGLKETGPGQYDPFFDYLAHEASWDELRYFTKQEYCGEIGFDDLIALTQVRLPEQAKLELARNFWDEQGQGRGEDVHGSLYEAMCDELGVRDTRDDEFVWETLAVANLLTALAWHRRYAWQSLGALSVIELTSPTRASRVAAGLERVGLSDRGCRYFRLHTVLDVDHWDAWLEHVIVPLLAETPELCVPLAEGALLRLNAGTRLIERYRAELGLDARGVRVGGGGRRPAVVS